MSGSSAFELISNEVMTAILSHITSQKDLNSLCRTSRSSYHRTVPTLYRIWSYHGLAKNPKNLNPWRNYLETLHWRPDLAVHVKELDLREWGNCPRFQITEDETWEERKTRHMEEQVKLDALEQESLVGTLGQNGGFWEDDEGDEMDGEYSFQERVEDGEAINKSLGSGPMDVEMDLSSDDDDELEEVEDIEADELADLTAVAPAQPLRDATINAIFLKTGKDMGFERPETIPRYAEILFESDEDKLVVLTLSLLPNLQNLWFVLPESAWHIEENILHQFLDDTNGLAQLGVLQQLEKLHICNPLHLGPKGHREYELDMKRVFPFMRLPKLQKLYTLTAHYFDDPGNFPPIDYIPLQNTSALTTLAFDDARLPPHDVFGALNIAQSLKHFRWLGMFRCHNPIGTCIPPFQARLGAALEKHKATLETLELDIRYPFCKGRGHYANPFATTDSIRGVYGDEMVEKWERDRGPKQAILIGSFKEFTSLRDLTIDANSLVGHHDWAASPTPLVELLPTSLVSLELLMRLQFAALPDNRLICPELVHLARSATVTLPNLKHIKLGVILLTTKSDDHLINPHNLTGSMWLQHFPDFKDVDRLCGGAGIAFEICLEGSRYRGETRIPYFLEQLKDRVPGAIQY